MNNSGEAVRAIVDWYKINLDQIFIIVADKDLPLGKIRFRKRKPGGHNGLKSIIDKLQTHNFNRIRIGIGSPQSIKGQIIQYYFSCIRKYFRRKINIG